MSNNIKINKDSWENNQPSSNQVAQVIYKSFDHGIHTINEKLRNTRGIDGFSYNSIDAQ